MKRERETVPAAGWLKDLILEPSWRDALAGEFEMDYFLKLESFLAEQYAAEPVFPPRDSIFAAFQTPLAKVKVVILGQDPYHQPKQAMGMSFSVPVGVPIPSSLSNMFKEIKAEMPDFIKPDHGDLTRWANQGAFLLNTTLTVVHGEPESHCDSGWKEFTRKVLEIVANQDRPIVFMLWGRHAQETFRSISQTPLEKTGGPKKHLVLISAHPSGLSASKGFFGNGHFSKANAFLAEDGQEPIVW